MRFQPYFGPCASRYSLVRHPSGATPMACPSYVFTPLQGISPKDPARYLSIRAPLMGLSHRSAHQFRRSLLLPVLPSHRVCVPRSGFLTLFAVYSSLGLAGLFHPANALRFHPSGSFPPGEQHVLFARALPSCRCTAVALPPSRSAGPAAHRAPTSRSGAGAFGRLHGLAPPGSPYLRAVGLAPSRGRSPPGFFLSRAFPSPSDATARHRHSSLAL
jgi:hypothetical protein